MQSMFRASRIWYACVICLATLCTTILSESVTQLDSRINLVRISELKRHELTDQRHVQELIMLMKRDGSVPHPVVVDKKTMIILDGHHRVQALTEMGYTFAPVYFVDYDSDDVSVTSWRPNMIVTKELVKKAALTGILLSIKTSRHTVKSKPTAIQVPLSLLR